MATHTTGITAAEIPPAAPDTVATSTASPIVAADSPNTGPTQQDWLEIFLGLATQLNFPAVRLRVDGVDGFVHAIILDRVVEDDGNYRFI